MHRHTMFLVGTSDSIWKFDKNLNLSTTVALKLLEQLDIKVF